jgi:parallel beta-helix repeat protein
VTIRPQRRPIAPVAGLLLALLALLLPFAGSASAAGPSFFVDGKHGNDANSGTSLGSAFKTIKAGLWALRYGGTLDVVGYNDYVYYETMTGSQWFINGTASVPVVIRGHGYGTSGSVRPIVSGAKVVSRPGQGKWTRPDATHDPNVWQTPWTTAIPGYEAAVNSFHQERVFVDVSQPLVRPASFSLANLQGLPGSQWWDGSKLYVRLGGWGSTSGASLDPNDHTIEIPYYSGLLAASGSNYVQIMGINLRHTTMGVGFTGSASHDLVQDVDASYNYTMGFFTASSYNTFRRITGTRNTIQLVKLDDGADHNVVEFATATENMGQGVKLTGSGTQFNTVRWSTFRGGKNVPTNQGQYGGYVQGIDIEQGANNNTIDGNTISNNRRGLMLYQVNSTGGALSGNTIKYNVIVGNDDGVVLWDGKYTTTQGKGAVTFYRNVYDSNAKAVTSESYTANKSFVHETLYKTGTVKTQSNSTFYLKAGSISVKDSIVYISAGYNFYAASGAKLTVSYTTFIGTGIAFRNSSATVVFGTGVIHLNPGFLSLDPVSADYLYIARGSAAYTVSSSRGPVGARWR